MDKYSIEKSPAVIYLPPALAARYGWPEHPNRYPQYVRADLVEKLKPGVNLRDSEA